MQYGHVLLAAAARALSDALPELNTHQAMKARFDDFTPLNSDSDDSGSDRDNEAETASEAMTTDGDRTDASDDSDEDNSSVASPRSWGCESLEFDRYCCLFSLCLRVAYARACVCMFVCVCLCMYVCVCVCSTMIWCKKRGRKVNPIHTTPTTLTHLSTHTRTVMLPVKRLQHSGV